MPLDALISHSELEEISRRYKRTAGFDPEDLNARPSLGIGQRPVTAIRPPARPIRILSS
jgi:hypothetical protein